METQSLILLQLPIYDPPPTDVFLLETLSALEAQIGTVRRTATGKYREAHEHVQGLVSRWIGVENKVEHRIKSLLPPDERLVQGVLYPAVALLSGSIVARNRSLPTRFLLPLILGAFAFAHFLPKTSANVRAYASALKDEHLPALAEVHETGKAHAGSTYARLREGGNEIAGKVRGGVLEAVERVQGATGLRIRQALGAAGEMEGKAERFVEERIRDVAGVVEKVEKTVEKKADEIAKERVV